MPPMKRKLEGGDGSETEGGEVRANITENGDTISCSVDETNRLRAQLGLRPLDTGASKEGQAVANFKKAQEEEAAAQNTAAIAERIAAARDRRLEQAKNSQQTLADVDTASAAERSLLSASDWVRNSRKVGLTAANIGIDHDHQKKPDSPTAAAAATEYTNKDLQGLGIQHDAAQFEEGEQVILTLADEQVLQKDDRGFALAVNTDADALENVNLAEAARLKDVQRRIKKSKQPVYNGYDDDEFDQDLPTVARGTKRGVLSQYDDAPKKARTRLVLGDKGLAAGIGAGADAGAGAGADDTKSAVPVSLQVQPATIGSDFYTETEFASFNKPKKEKKLRKKRKLRVKNEEEDEEGAVAGKKGEDMEVENSTDGVEAFRTRGGPVGASGQAIAAKEDERMRRMAYDRAVLAAERKSSGSTKSTTVQESSAVVQSDRRSGEPGEVDDQGAVWAQKMAARVKVERSIVDTAAAASTVAVDAASAGTGAVVFTSTMEFSNLLQIRVDDENTARSERVQNEAVASAAGSVSVKVEEREHTESQHDSTAMDAEPVTAMDDESKAEGVRAITVVKTEGNSDAAFGAQQPLARSSMAATLSLLKGSGDLEASKKEKLAGRAKDSRVFDPSSSVGGEFDVQLDYRDEFGRKVTQKEAFRQLNYAFHGIGPSKKSQEKRIKAMEKANQQAALDRGVDSGSMIGLLNTQRVTGSAHMVLSGSGANFLSSSRSDADAVVKLAQEQHEKKVAWKAKQDKQNNL